MWGDSTVKTRQQRKKSKRGHCVLDKDRTDLSGANQVRLEARANFVKSLFFNVPCNFSMTNTMLSEDHKFPKVLGLMVEELRTPH